MFLLDMFPYYHILVIMVTREAYIEQYILMETNY